jgi:hypothetical protein
MQNSEKLIVGYPALAEFLTDEGYPISKSTISKYCSPAINIGPPAEGFWGRLRAFKPSEAIAWAKARVRPAGEAQSRRSIADPDVTISEIGDGASSAQRTGSRRAPK